MTINFKWLKDTTNSTTDEVLVILEGKWICFFNGWLSMNKKIYPLKKIDDYIIDLPAILLDEIINDLKQ